MKLENEELNFILKALDGYIERSNGHPNEWAISAKQKLEEFMQTSGTTCPTATLTCPFSLGSRTSERKRDSSRENGKKGGRPKKARQNEAGF